MSAFTTCRGCNAAIRWIKTKGGRSMPVDPLKLHEWVVDDRGAPRILLCGDDGYMREGKMSTVATVGARLIEGYMPHWATCPQAKKFKREQPFVTPRSVPEPDR